MKTSIITMLASVLVISVNGQGEKSDSTGLPGDNLDLQGVLELFKQSSSVEAFEKAINTTSNEVNNLDLNNDGSVDYIRVVAHKENDAHAIVLQVPVNATEAQDVATIEIEKTTGAEAHLQVAGDEDLYNKDYFVEPKPESTAPTKCMRGAVLVNVWLWPCVRFVYGPKYVAWVSPWRFGVYPPWWKPWRPVAWHVHHRRVLRYHAHCHVVRVQHLPTAHRVYHRHRIVSATVRKNHPQRIKASPVKSKPVKNKPVNRKTPSKKGISNKKHAPVKKSGVRK